MHISEIFVLLFLGGSAISGPVPAGDTVTVSEVDFSTWTFLDELKIPFNFRINGMTIGGNVGLAYDRANDVHYLIQDMPEGPVLIRVNLGMDDVGFEVIDLLVPPVLPLLDTNMEAFALEPVRTVHPQSLAFHAPSQTLWWVNQEDETGKSSIRQMGMDGILLREWFGDSAGPVPAFHVPNTEETMGVRPGLGYSGMTFHPDDRTLEVVSAGPFFQDCGAEPTTGGTAPVRVTYYDVDAPEVGSDPAVTILQEHIYQMGPIPTGFDKGVVSEVHAIDAQNTLYLETYENTLIPDSPQFAAALYSVDRTTATDVQAMDSVIDVEVTPLLKTLVQEINEAELQALTGRTDFPVDRLSNMNFGKSLEDGRRVIFIGSNSELLGRPRFQHTLAWTYQQPPQ